MKAATASTLMTALMVCSVMSIPACAEDWDFNWDINRYHATRHHRRVQPAVRYYRQPEIIIERDRDDGRRGRDDVGKCLESVRGLGTQWVGVEGALEAARKDWMERTRYDHGESFIDMGHSINFRSRCGRVSIGEIAGQVLYRCEIVANPCRGVFEEGEAQTK